MPPIAAFALPLLSSAWSSAWLADDPTWARDVAPILFENCAACHRPGETAPFALLTFDDAAAHAEQLARVVASRIMPPWLPEPPEPSDPSVPGGGVPPFAG